MLAEVLTIGVHYSRLADNFVKFVAVVMMVAVALGQGVELVVDRPLVPEAVE